MHSLQQEAACGFCSWPKAMHASVAVDLNKDEKGGQGLCRDGFFPSGCCYNYKSPQMFYHP